MSAGGNQVGDDILFLGSHSALTLTASVLAAIVTQQCSLDVIFGRQKDHAFLFWDQFFIREFTKLMVNDLRTALITVFLLHLEKLGLDNLENFLLVGENAF